MRWLLDNIQIVIAVAGLIAYYLNEHRRRKAQREAEDENGNPLGEQTELGRSETNAEELDEEVRTRQIREEMLRRRAEREAGRAQPQPPTLVPSPAPQARRLDAPPPVFQDPLGDLARRLAKQMNPQPEEKPGYLVDETALQRQRQLEEQMRALEAQRKEALRKAEDARKASAPKAPALAASNLGGDSWLTQLRSPEGVRRAIVMNEVLGKPVGLR